MFIGSDMRGGSTTQSPINNVDFQRELRAFIKENARKKGEKVLTIADIRVWVCERLQLAENDWYSEDTVLRWVHKIGFKVHTMRKSIYVDGHEREDVIREREEFIRTHDELRKRSWQADDETLEEKPTAEAELLFISEDEKCFHSYDLQKRWDTLHILPSIRPKNYWLPTYKLTNRPTDGPKEKCPFLHPLHLLFLLALQSVILHYLIQNIV